MKETSELALFGGPKSITIDPGDIFEWPIITQEDEMAVLAIMHKQRMMDHKTIALFEQEVAAYYGTQFVLTFNNGTGALFAAMFACGVGHGDEVIAPSATYWATILPCLGLGATMVFADIDPLTLNLDPQDIERRITERTKAIVVVHQLGYPADMDEINRIAKRHGICVIEDAAHAHGTVYKGRKAGTLADVATFSFCGKPLALGEGGMLVTNNRAIYERAIAWGHSTRFNHANVYDPTLLQYSGLPMGGVNSRIHPMSAALGRVQLRHYEQRRQEIDRAMNYFWDRLEDVEGLLAHRPAKDSGSTMGGWYCPHGIYLSEKFEGLSVARFAQAIRAEGFHTLVRICLREPLHVHPLVNTCDIYGQGSPTRIANAARDVRQPQGSLPVTERVSALTVPPFRRFCPEIIDQYIACFRKVASHYAALLEGDPGNESVVIDERGNG